MALRVLLADESSTIKKVFQLALQDFAVEVKPVALGLDVATVSQDFQPDIIFADVLLQKKNGYDVCAELKSNPALAKIPVVLMWSGFMELDQDKYQASGANDALEKPFDVAQLRKVINDLVPKTKTQSLSKYLEFPNLPEIEESAPPIEMEDESEEDDFKPVSIPKINTQKEKFQMNIDPLSEDEAEITFQKPKAQLNDDEVMDDEDFSFHRPGRAQATTPQAPVSTSGGFDLSREDIREIVERLAPKIIEEIAWKIVPELAAQVIEREIKSLLAEKEKELTP